MSDPVEFLDLDDVIDLAVALLGDPAPMRDIGLLGSAVARPQTTAFGDDAYPDIWTNLVIDVAAGQPTVDAIAERLRQLTTNSPPDVCKAGTESFS